MTRVWALALFGSSAGVVGDMLCVWSARGASVWWVVLAGVLFAAMAPVWFWMARDAGGSFTQPAVTWSVVATALSVCAALALDHHAEPRQWVSFALVIAAALVR